MISSSKSESGQSDTEVPDNCSAMDQSESLHDIDMTLDMRSPRNTNDNKKTSTNETESETTPQEETLATETITELESPELEVGDHVYQWRSLCGVPYMFQHHGIVMDVIKDEEGKPVRLTIADFSNVETKGAKKEDKKPTEDKENVTNNQEDSDQNTLDDIVENPSQQAEMETNNTITRGRSMIFSSRQVSLETPGLEQEGIMRTYTDTDKWHKVNYETGWWTRQVRRSGTVTGVKADPVGLVLARVNFIMQHPEQLPDYHVVHANCECVAFWCKTGTWSTLQASSFLELTAAG